MTSHSSGEIAAAYAAGALDLASAMAIVHARGGLASESNRGHARKGGMVAVGLGVKESEKYLSQISTGQVVVACENSPSSITVSGDVSGLDQLEAVLKQDNVFARRLKVDAAWHSHHMEAVAEAYYAFMDKKVKPAQDHLDFIFSSPSTGKRMDEVNKIGSPAHWVHSLTGPVQFVDAFRNMCFDGSSTKPCVDMVIEVGPHAALSGPIQDIMSSLAEFKGTNIPYASCLIRKQSAVDTMQALVGGLLRKGHTVDLAAVNFPLGTYNLKVIHNLPSYPWNHQTRHWTEPRINKALRNRSHAPHDLLGSLVLGTDMNAPSWKHIVRINDMPWVRDHMVQSNIIYPAAGYIAMAIEGMQIYAAQKAGDKQVLGYQLRDIEILNALVVPETSDGIEMQLSLRPCDEKVLSTKGWTEFQVQSVNGDNKWTNHCKGVISIEYSGDGDAPKWLASQHPSRELTSLAKPSEYRTRINPGDIYAGMRSGGICHGPIFQNIKSIRVRGGKQSVTTFSVADSASMMPKNHQHPHVVHPTTLDSVFQAAYTAVPGAGGKKPTTPKVPRSISKLWIAHDTSLSQAGHAFAAYTELNHADGQTMNTAISVVDQVTSASDAPKKTPLITIDGFVCQSIGNAPVVSESTQPWESDKFAVAKWAPDVTFLKEAFLQKQLGSRISSEEAELLMDLRQACLFFIYDALDQLSPADVKRLEWYHKKFYIWMRLQAELARTNQLGPESRKWARMSAKQKGEVIEKVRGGSTNGEMVCRLGPKLSAILRGEVTPLEVMLEDDCLSRYYLDGLKWGRANAKLAELVRHYVHKNPRAKMIEIGGGTGGATAHVLRAIGGAKGDGSSDGPRAASYDFTDVSSGFFEAAKEKFKDWEDLMRFRKLNIEQDPVEQGFEEGTYDVVIACQVLHATKSMDGTMANVRRLLKPGGKLFIMETTKDQLDVQFVFGFFQGWWLSEEEERKFSPSLSVPMWDRVLHRSGFRGVEAEVRDCDDDELYSFSVISSTATAPAPPAFDFDIKFVTASAVTPEVWLDKLRVSIGLLTCTVPTVQSLEEVTVEGDEVCIFVDDMAAPILAGANKTQFEGLRTICTKSKGLLWLTRGGADECEQPLASLAAGFLRSLRQEYCGKRLGSLDLDPAQPTFSDESITTITDVFRKLFDHNSTDDNTARDYEFADRNGAICIPRYIKDVQRNQSVFAASDAQKETRLEPFLQPDRPLRLTVGTTGLLDTLAFDDDPTAAEPLPEDFVEVTPHAFGVNFRDVMVAMGQLKSQTMGYDCAGVVSRVGPKAAGGLKPGDRVSVLLRGHYASRVRVHWTSAVQIPDDMSFETAASLPTQYVAAYVSLYDTARLQKGEKVLIHAATGGVGQAAVMMAQRVGAEVFVTVGSEEKRDFVMEHYGIPADHIFSSRDTSFAAGVKAMTQGRGVDVVLNSLAGTLLQESFNCLAPFGRFVEIGKRDLELNSSLAMEAFTRAVSFSSIDVIALGERKPMDANRIMKDVVRMVSAGELRTVAPITVYPLGEVEKAFRLMQAGKHMGKSVLEVNQKGESLVPVSSLPSYAPPPPSSSSFPGGRSSDLPAPAPASKSSSSSSLAPSTRSRRTIRSLTNMVKTLSRGLSRPKSRRQLLSRLPSQSQSQRQRANNVAVQVLPKTSPPTGEIRSSDASYLVIGGFGGIGRSVCRWLAERGAKSLVVASRNAATATDKLEQLRLELEDAGCEDVQVTAISCDISDMAGLKKALDECVASGVPSIKGIIHGGMDLRVSPFPSHVLDYYKPHDNY